MPAVKFVIFKEPFTKKVGKWWEIGKLQLLLFLPSRQILFLMQKPHVFSKYRSLELILFCSIFKKF